MAIFEFSLMLENVFSSIPNLEEKLYRKNCCNDSLISFYGERIELDFDREAESLTDAIISAIASVESCGLDAKVFSVNGGDLVGLSDIAELCGLSRQAISYYKNGDRGDGDFPDPIILKESTNLWSWVEVSKWMVNNKKIAPQLSTDAETVANINKALEFRRLKQDCDMQTATHLLSLSTNRQS